MTAREIESAMLVRCSAVAMGLASSAEDQREANLFRLAAMVLRSRFPGESVSLMQASERYFALHPDQKLDPADVVRNGWIFSMPRFRDMLTHSLGRS